MKRLLIFLLFSCSTVLIAQNWSPILVNDKMNYQHSDSTYISHTIWVDSAGYSGYDSIFYLNRVVKDVPGNPEIVLRNQPQFLMELMVKQTYGIYSFHYPFNYSISTGLPLGATWLFDLTNIIDAEITACYEEEIFGVLDSVKMISLSDGNEILISKNFGIIKFPDFENGGYFELVGIQDTEYGESVIDFWDIFDFEIGDVFQRYTEFYWPGYYKVETIKTQINDKQVSSFGFTYNISQIIRRLHYGQVTIITIDEDIFYEFDENSRANKFQHELINLEPCDNLDIYSRISIFPDSLGNMSKHWGTFFGQTYVEFFYITQPVGDTLIVLDDAECLWINPHGLTWTESLGMNMRYSNDNFECWNYTVLTGYIKDGDTIGVITSDSLLLVGIESFQTNIKTTYSVYPNPIQESLYIKNNNEYIPYCIEIRNLIGQMVREVKNIKSLNHTISLSDLKPGVYFYVIKENGEIVQQGKLIKK